MQSLSLRLLRKSKLKVVTANATQVKRKVQERLKIDGYSNTEKLKAKAFHLKRLGFSDSITTLKLYVATNMKAT